MYLFVKKCYNLKKLVIILMNKNLKKIFTFFPGTVFREDPMPERYGNFWEKNRSDDEKPD